MSFTAYTYDPDDIKRRRDFAAQALTQGMDMSPSASPSPLIGVARALQGLMGGYMNYAASQAEKRGKEETGKQFLGLPDWNNSSGVAAPTTTDPSTVSPEASDLAKPAPAKQFDPSMLRKDAPTGPRPAALSDPFAPPKPSLLLEANLPNTAGKSDMAPMAPPVTPDAPAPSPIPLSPKDRDLLIRTVYGEAANEPDEGKAAVVHAVLNRKKAGTYGNSISDILMAPNQFEPWQTRKSQLMSLSPNSPGYQKTGQLVDAVVRGEMPDPTKGAVNFLNPAVVRQRRGGSLPPWASGQGMQIGNHTFYGGGGPNPVTDAPLPSAPVDVTQAAPGVTQAALPAPVTPPEAPVAPVQAPSAPVPPEMTPFGISKEALAFLNNPAATPEEKAFILAQAKERMSGNDWELKDIETGSMGGKRTVLFNKRTTEMKDLPGTSQQSNNDDLTGDALLKTLPVNDRTIVKAYANYELDPTKVSTLRNNRRETLLAYAQRVNPDLNPGNYANIYATKQSFSGAGKHITSLRGANQALEHMGELLDKWDAQNKSPLAPFGPAKSGTFGAKYLNKARTKYMDFEQDPTLASVDAPITGVKHEIAKLFHGVGATGEKEADEWGRTLANDMSPEGQLASGKTLVQLLGGGVSSYRQLYEDSVGPAYAAKHPFEEVFHLTPKAQATLKRVGLTPADLGLNSEAPDDDQLDIEEHQ